MHHKTLIGMFVEETEELSYEFECSSVGRETRDGYEML